MPSSPYSVGSGIPPLLQEPQKSPPPPRPHRTNLKASPWSPASYTSPFVGRLVRNAAAPISASTHVLQRESTAKTYRQLDWSADEADASLQSPREMLDNASLAPSGANSVDTENNSSAICVLSRSFGAQIEDECTTSTAPHPRSQAVCGPLARGTGDAEWAGPERALIAKTGDDLVTVAVTHAANIALSLSEEERPAAASADVRGNAFCARFQRVSHLAVPSGSASHVSPQGRRRSRIPSDSVYLSLSMQRLPCSFHVAQQVLSQPSAKTRWDSHLRDATVLCSLDSRRAAVVRETREGYPRGSRRTCLCFARDDLCPGGDALAARNGTALTDATKRANALAVLAATAVPSDRNFAQQPAPSRACAWASVPLPDESLDSRITHMDSKGSHPTDACPISAVILMVVSPAHAPPRHPIMPVGVNNDEVWVFVLHSTVNPSGLSLSALSDQCSRLSVLCALEQDAVDASSMRMVLTPLRFPKPNGTPDRLTRSVTMQDFLSRPGAYFTALDASLRTALASLRAWPVHDASQHVPAAPFTRETCQPHISSRDDPVSSTQPLLAPSMGQSPEPRQPRRSSLPTILSSWLSSSWSSSVGSASEPDVGRNRDLSPLHGASTEKDELAAKGTQSRPPHVSPNVTSPAAMSHNLDGVSSIGIAGDADLSVQAPHFPITPTALDGHLKSHTSAPTATTHPLTAEALPRHRRAQKHARTQGNAAARARPSSSSSFAVSEDLGASKDLKVNTGRSPERTTQGLRITLLCCTGLPRLAGDVGNGEYQLGVVARFSSGACVQSEWYPYNRSINFLSSTGTDTRKANVFTCLLRKGHHISSSESLTLTVVIRTPQKKIRLGVAVLSVVNLREKPASIVACHMIGKAGTLDAQERCLLQLSVLPVRCGLPASSCVPLVEEARRRQLLWRALQTRAPAQLHRLEWFVGLCRPLHTGNEDVNELLSRLLGAPGTPQRAERRARRRHSQPGRRTVFGQPFEDRAHPRTEKNTDSSARRSGPRASVLNSRESLADPRRSLSLPLLRRVKHTRSRVEASDEAAAPAEASPRIVARRSDHHADIAASAYTVRLRIGEVACLCDRYGELLNACASTFVVATLLQRPAMRRRPASTRKWTTESVPYLHHVATFPESRLVLSSDDLYDTILRVTVMAGNAESHSVVGYCDVSLRYVLSGSSHADEGGTSHRSFHLYGAQLSSSSCSAAPLTATARTAATPANRLQEGHPRAYRPVGTISLDLRCDEACMAHYLDRRTVREAIAHKQRHTLTVAALLTRYRPSLLPSLDVQLDQVAAHGLSAFVKRKSALWDCDCQLSGLARLSVCVLNWSLCAIRTASPLVSDPRRFTEVVDPRTLVLHAARLGEYGANTLPFPKLDSAADTPSVYVVGRCGNATFAASGTTQCARQGLQLSAHFNRRLATQVATSVDDILSLRVMQRVVDGSADYEVGRVDVPLSVFCVDASANAVQRLTVPLTSSAGTRIAYQCGSLSFDVGLMPLSPHDASARSHPPSATWRGFDETWSGRTKLTALLYQRAPWLLHRTLVLLKDARTDAQAAAVSDLYAAQFGARQSDEPYGVQVVALRGVDPEVKACYVKVYHGEKAILRTSTLSVPSGSRGGGCETLPISDDGACTYFTVSDAEHDVLRVKLGRQKRLGRNQVIARAQVSLAGVTAESAHDAPDMWIPLFEVSQWDSCVAGDVCLRLFRGTRNSVATTTPKREVAVFPFPSRGQHGAVSLEQQKRDVVSLLQAYAPLELPRIHSLLSAVSTVAVRPPGDAEGVSARSAHVPLRAMLAPVSVAGTVHVTVEGIDLSYGEVLPAEFFNADTLRVAISTWGSPIATCACPLTSTSSLSSQNEQTLRATISSSPSVARLDVPVPMALDGTATTYPTALEFVLEHTQPVSNDHETVGGRLRGRLGVGGAAGTAGASSRPSSSRRTSVLRSRSGGPASRSSSLGWDSSGARTTTATTTTAGPDSNAASGGPAVTAVPVGQCRVSLRALLTPELYAAGETVSVPLVCSSRTLAFRLLAPHRQHFEEALRTHGGTLGDDDLFVLGRLRFSVRLAGGDRAPSWLRLAAPRTPRQEMQRRRRVAERERSLQAAHDLKGLMHVHYTALEWEAETREGVSASDWQRARTPVPVRRTRSGAGYHPQPRAQDARARSSPVPRRPCTTSTPSFRSRLALKHGGACGGALGSPQGAKTDGRTGSAITTISTPFWTT